MTACRGVTRPRRSLARLRRRHRRVVTVAAGAASLALVAGGCGLFANANALPAAQVTITPASGSANVDPGSVLTVAVAHGRLRSVVVQSDGNTVGGDLINRGTQWRAAQTLSVNTRYTITAVALGQNDRRVTTSSTFTTLKPHVTFGVTILNQDQQYGVGMPIVLNFDQPIINKAAVERALNVTTSVPTVGAWYWDGDKTVEFRPKVYWQPGTKVSVFGRFNGVEAARGVYGTSDVSQSFWIGPSLIVHASTVTHYMDIYYKGKLFGHWPISTGRPGDDTYNGAYLTIEKGNPTFMKGPGYALWVYWAVRFTWSGEYIHSAPWSIYAQGLYNVSHGCVNTSPEHAQTFYQMADPGDPVIVTGSPSNGYWGNGWTEWFLSWPKLLAGSALHSGVEAGPSGSVFVSADSLLQPPAPPSAGKIRPVKHGPTTKASPAGKRAGG